MPAAAKQRRYTIQSPVIHDGRRYEIGETIELAEDQAVLLIAVGAVIEVTGKKSNG